MFFRIENMGKLSISILVFLIISYVFFKIFHYYYPGNYCDFLSATVIKQSQEEKESMAHCINTLICEIGNIETVTIISEDNIESGEKKHFICMRKFKPGVWK